MRSTSSLLGGMAWNLRDIDTSDMESNRVDGWRVGLESQDNVYRRDLLRSVMGDEGKAKP